MKTKTKQFADTLLADPKISQTEAYLRTHKTTNRKSAGASASKLLAKPSVSIYMEEHIKKAQERIVSLVDEASKEEVQLRAAQDILDRTHGKATQRVTSTSYNFMQNVSTQRERYNLGK